MNMFMDRVKRLRLVSPAHRRSGMLIGLTLCCSAKIAFAESPPVVDAGSAAGKTGGAKIASAYHSPECRLGCIIDATKLRYGADLDLDGFNAQNMIAITKPVQIRLGEGDYRLSGSVMLRGDPQACDGNQQGATCVVDGMGLIGAGSNKTRLHFTKDSNVLINRRLVMVLAHFAPNRVPDLFAPEPADNAIAGPVILPGSSSFVAQDPAQIKGLRPGTWILVGDMHRSPANGAADFQHYEWKQVANTGGGAVHVTEGFVRAYNTMAGSCSHGTRSCDKAYWITLASVPRGPQISGLTILDETASLNPTALYVSGAIDPLITDVRTQIGAAAGSEAFALRFYRTLRPRMNGFFAGGARPRMEVSHAIGGRFSGIQTQCPSGPMAAGYLLTVDFGSTANVFDGNSTNCGSGFLVVEASGNVFTGNTIKAPLAASSAGSLGQLSGSAGFAVYGGEGNRFEDNVIEGLAFGLYIADFPAGNGRVWTSNVKVQDGACVRPTRMNWLFFCTRRGGITGPREPDFSLALAGSPQGSIAVGGSGEIRWLLAGSVHPSSGSRFEANRLVNVSKAVVDNSVR